MSVFSPPPFHSLISWAVIASVPCLMGSGLCSSERNAVFRRGVLSSVAGMLHFIPIHLLSSWLGMSVRENILYPGPAQLRPRTIVLVWILPIFSFPRFDL